MELKITIRTMPGGEEFDAFLEDYTTGRELLDTLLNEGTIPSSDQGNNPYSYNMIIKSRNMQIQKDKTLGDLGVQDGDTIIVQADLIAG